MREPPDSERGAAGHDTPKKSQSKLEPNQLTEVSSEVQARSWRAKIAAFNYGCLTPSDAADLQDCAVRLRSLVTKSTADMIEIGRGLIAVKARLEHGQFTDWIEQEIGVGIRSAQGYIAIAKLADRKSETVALLPPSTARMLAAKSASPEIVEQIISRAGSGDIVSEVAVKEMIEEDREAKCIARREAEKAARQSKIGKKTRERAAAAREAWRAEQEREKAKARAKAQSIIDRFSPKDVRFLAEMLTWEVWDEFCRLVAEGGFDDLIAADGRA